MDTPARSEPPDPARRKIWLAGAVLALAALAAWANSFTGPFVLDDVENIATNPSLRHLSAWREVLSPPADTGFGGRPVLNLSFALNYAYGGLSLRGYHAVNLAIHIGAGLVLLGLIRRTLLTPRLRPRYGADALALALAAALLWTLHPVQTASVTYLSQRAESLMGLFYLLTLYCFARSTECHPLGDTAPPAADRPASLVHRFRTRLWTHRWAIGAVCACALGMATKEVTATAPLLVLLYDRTFFAGSFSGALRSRPRLYLALVLTWVPLIVLLADASARGIGTGRGVTWTTYAFTECQAVLHYLSLALWPSPLIFDYGTDFIHRFSDAWPYALALAPLVIGTLLALARRPGPGFFGAWFFVILAPTSTVVPIAFMPVAENRLYLPLAAILVGFVLAVHALGGRRALTAAFVVIVVYGALTFRRNHDYRSELALWRDTVEKCPANAHARYNLGFQLSRAGRNADAAAEWRATLRDEPLNPPAHDNLANTLVALGRIDEALQHYEAALHQQPNFTVLRANYGLILLYLGHPREAEAQLRLAVKQGPNNISAQNNLAMLLDRTGRLAEALPHYEAALRIDPNFVNAHHNLGVALARSGRLDEGISHLKTAIRLQPNDPETLLNLVQVLMQAGRLPDAQVQAAAAVSRFPDSAPAHFALANVLAYQGQLPAAVGEYEVALRLQPNFKAASDNLAIVRARLPH